MFDFLYSIFGFLFRILFDFIGNYGIALLIFTLFFKIILPLSKSVIITSILLTMSGVWGDFFWPQMILKDDALHTIMLAILKLKYTYPVDIQLAGLVFAIVPPVVIFLFLQKYIMEGFTMSGIKG